MLSLDLTTRAAYDAAPSANARAQAALDAITAATVYVRVYNHADVKMGEGTMQAPWAVRSNNVLTFGELQAFSVIEAGTPIAGWYLRVEGNGRWLRGTFGLAGSGADFVWSLPTWEPGQAGIIGTVTATSLIGTPALMTLSTAYAVSGATVTFGWVIEETAPQRIGPFDAGVTGQTWPLGQYANTSGATPAYTVLSGPADVSVDQASGLYAHPVSLPAGTGYLMTVRLTQATVQAPLLVLVSNQYFAVTFNWAAVAGALSYEVERYAGGTWGTPVTTAALTYSDSSVAAQTAYQYRVRALGATGYGPYSAVLPVTTPAAPVIAGAEEDWLYRSGQDPARPQPGVIWAHDFRTQAELDKFRYTSKDSLRVTRPTSWRDQQRVNPNNPALGQSMMIKHTIIGAQLTQDVYAASTRIYLNDVSGFPDPAVVGPYGDRNEFNMAETDLVLLGTAGNHFGEFSNDATVTV